MASCKDVIAISGEYLFLGSWHFFVESVAQPFRL